jgi:hypothetical protein
MFRFLNLVLETRREKFCYKNVRSKSNMAAYKMATIKVTPPNYLPLGLLRAHMVVIHLLIMLCDLQGVVRNLCTTL